MLQNEGTPSHARTIRTHPTHPTEGFVPLLFDGGSLKRTNAHPHLAHPVLFSISPFTLHFRDKRTCICTRHTLPPYAAWCTPRVRVTKMVFARARLRIFVKYEVFGGDYKCRPSGPRTNTENKPEENDTLLRLTATYPASLHRKAASSAMRKGARLDCYFLASPVRKHMSNSFCIHAVFYR